MKTPKNASYKWKFSPVLFLVCPSEAIWEVLALEGNRVLRLTYNGALDLSEWFDDIAAMLTPVE